MSEQMLMISELDGGDEAALVNPLSPSYLAADVMEGGSGAGYRTVKISYELLADVLSQYGAVADAIEAMSSPTRLKGYYAAQDPSTVAHITLRVGELWWQGAGSDMPIVFPVSGLRQWDGRDWEPAPAYTAGAWDLWVNINDDAGYYWFGDHWNQYDSVADGVTLENYGGKVRIKDLGVGWDKLAAEIKEMIQNSVQRSGDTMEGALHIEKATSGDTPYQKQEIDEFHFAHKETGASFIPDSTIEGTEANDKIIFAGDFTDVNKVILTIKRNFYIPGNAGTHLFSIDVYNENDMLIRGLGQYEFTDEDTVFVDVTAEIGAAELGSAAELRVFNANAKPGSVTAGDMATAAVYKNRLLDLKDEMAIRAFEDAKLNERADRLNQKIEQENYRAENAESVLSNAILQESERAGTAEHGLNQKIEEETGRAENAEENLAGAINQESERAVQAEAQLAGAIEDETLRAQGVEDTLLPRKDVVNDLETGGAEKALSAEQGVILKRLIGGSMVGNFLYSMGRTIPKEWCPLKGIRIAVEDCPSLYEAIRAGVFPCVSERDWTAEYNAQSGTCGKFGYTGADIDNAAEIIVPHLMNGAYLVSRQDKAAGAYIKDSIVDIQGRWVLGRGIEGSELASGAFKQSNGASDNGQGHGSYTSPHQGAEFKASNVVHTDDRVQPRSVNAQNILMFIGDNFNYNTKAITPVMAEDCDLDLVYEMIYQIITTIPLMIKNISSESKIFLLNGATTALAAGAVMPLARNDKIVTIQGGFKLIISTAAPESAFDYKLGYESGESVLANKWYKYDDGTAAARNIKFFPIDENIPIDDVELFIEDSIGAYHIEKAIDFFFSEQIKQPNPREREFVIEKTGVNKRFMFIGGAAVSNVKIFYDFIDMNYDCSVLLPRVPYRWKEELRAVPQENFYTINNSGSAIVIAYRPRNNALGRFGTGTGTVNQGAVRDWTSTAAAAANAIICKGYADDKAKDGAYPALTAYVVNENKAIDLNATATNLTKDAVYKINFGMDGGVYRTSTHYYLGQITNFRTEPVTLTWIDDPSGAGMTIPAGTTSPLIKQGQSFRCTWDGAGSGNVTWTVNPNTDGSDIDMLMYGQYINSTGQIRTLVNKSNDDYKYYIGTALKTINPHSAYAVNNAEVVRPNDALRLESWMGQDSHEPDKIPKTKLIYNEHPDVIDLDDIPDKRILRVRPLRPIKCSGTVRKYTLNPRSVAFGFYYDSKQNWAANGGVDTVGYIADSHTGIFFNKASGTTIAAGDYTDNLFAGDTPHGIGGEDIYIYRNAAQPTVAVEMLSGAAQTLTNNAPYIAKSVHKNLILSCPNQGEITLGRYDDKYVSMREYEVPASFGKIPLGPGDVVHTYNSNGVRIETGADMAQAAALAAGVLYYNADAANPKFIYKTDGDTPCQSAPLFWKGGKLSQGSREAGLVEIIFNYDWIQPQADNELSWVTPANLDAPVSNDNTPRRVIRDGLKLINAYTAQTLYICRAGDDRVTEIQMETGDELELYANDYFYVYNNVDIEEV